MVLSLFQCLLMTKQFFARALRFYSSNKVSCENVPGKVNKKCYSISQKFNMAHVMENNVFFLKNKRMLVACIWILASGISGKNCYNWKHHPNAHKILQDFLLLANFVVPVITDFTIKVPPVKWSDE